MIKSSFRIKFDKNMSVIPYIIFNYFVDFFSVKYFPFQNIFQLKENVQIAMLQIENNYKTNDFQLSSTTRVFIVAH